MVIEVTFQTKKDAADPHSHFRHTEFFEVSTMPDKSLITRQLSTMHKDFADGSISISEYKDKDVLAMRESGLRVTKL